MKSKALRESLRGRFEGGLLTSTEHKIKASESGRSGAPVLWRLYWQKLDGIDGHHHVGHVSKEHDCENLVVGLFTGTVLEPHDTVLIASFDDAKSASDAELEKC